MTTNDDTNDLHKITLNKLYEVCALIEIERRLHTLTPFELAEMTRRMKNIGWNPRTDDILNPSLKKQGERLVPRQVPSDGVAYGTETEHALKRHAAMAGEGDKQRGDYPPASDVEDRLADILDAFLGELMEFTDASVDLNRWGWAHRHYIQRIEMELELLKKRFRFVDN